MSQPEEKGGKRWDGRVLDDTSGGKRLPENMAKALAAQGQAAQVETTPGDNEEVVAADGAGGSVPRPYHYD